MIFKNSIFFCLFLSMLLLLLYSGDRIYLCMLIILAAVFLCCLLSLLYACFFLRVRQRVTPAAARKSDSIRYGIALKNAGIFPVPYVKISYSSPLSGYTGELLTRSFSLTPFGARSFEIPVDCPYRGVYRFGIQHLELRDVLGFLTLRLPARHFRLGGGCELTILPRVRGMGAAGYDGGDEDSNEDVSDSVSGEPDAADIRAWMPGDPLRTIHWKLSARLGEFLTRDWNTDTRPESYFFINNVCHGKEGLSGLALEDLLVECAVSCVNTLLRAGMPLRCVYYAGHRITLRGDGPQAFGEFYRALSLMTFQSEFPLKDILDSELRAAGSERAVFVVTPPPDSVLACKLAELAGIGHNVRALIVTDDNDGTDDGTIGRLESAGVSCAALSADKDNWEGLF